MKKKVALHNLGCKVNAYETEAMGEELANSGYEIVPFEEGADIYIINTCTVTNTADNKSKQVINNIKKNNKDAIVIAMGCFCQFRNSEIEDLIDADIILGNKNKHKVLEYLK